MKKFQPGLPHLLSPIAIECLKDTEGAIRLMGKILVWFITIWRLTIVCPFSEEVTVPVQRLRAVRWRVIRFFRDCEDVPFVFGLLFLITVFVMLRLLFGCSLHFGFLDWAGNLDALVPSQPFLPVDMGGKFSYLSIT